MSPNRICHQRANVLGAALGNASSLPSLRGIGLPSQRVARDQQIHAARASAPGSDPGVVHEKAFGTRPVS
jgi:hypothetical protein